MNKKLKLFGLFFVSGLASIFILVSFTFVFSTLPIQAHAESTPVVTSTISFNHSGWSSFTGKVGDVFQFIFGGKDKAVTPIVTTSTPVYTKQNISENIPITQVINTPTTIIQQISQAGLTGKVGPQGLQGPRGLTGPKGDQGIPGSSIDSSSFVLKSFLSNQVDRIYDSLNKSISTNSNDITEGGTLNNPTFTGTTTVSSNIINLSGSNPIIDSTLGTLSINTTTGNPVTFGSGMVTIPNLNASVVGTITKADNLTGGNATTLLGSIPYQSNTDTTTLLFPNTTATKKFLTMTGTGTNGVVPSWNTVTATDVGLGNVTNESKAIMFTSPTFTGTVASFTMGGNFALGANTFTTSNTNVIINLNSDLLDGQHGAYYATASSLSSYIPYTGATGNVTLGTYSLTTPNILGGTSTTQDLTLQTTSGVGATGADMHFLVGNAGATEAMTILNDGKVGVGLALPLQPLDVVGNIHSSTSLLVGSGSAGLTTSGATDIKIIDGAGNTTFRGVRAGAWADSVNAGFFQIGNSSDNIAFTAQSGTRFNRLQLSSNITQIGGGAYNTIPAPISGDLFELYDNSNNARIVVQQTGNVGIGTTSPSNLLQVTGTPISGTHTARIANTLGGTTQNNGLLILAGNNTGVATSEMITFKRPDATVIGSITQNAAATIAFNTSSDKRIKDNIIPTTYGLQDLMKIEVDDFTFKSDPNHQTMTGFIAQELNNIFPGAVTTNGDNGTDVLDQGKTSWMVDYSKLTPLLVKSVQDMNLKITDISNLEKENTWRDSIISWFANSTNGINSFFSKEIHTDKVCVGNTCVTEEQFLEIVNNNRVTSSSTTETEITPKPEIIITPESIPDPVVEEQNNTVVPEEIVPEVAPVTEEVQAVAPVIVPEPTVTSESN